MAQYYEENHRSFTTDAAYGRGLRVKASSTKNQITLAGAGDVELGTLTAACFNVGDTVDVLLSSSNGTIEMVASGAINAGAYVYPDAGGKVTATQNGLPIGVCLWPASANNDFVEVIRVDPRNSGKMFVGVNAADTVTNTVAETAFAMQFSVPANILQPGDRLKIRLQGTVTSHNSTDTLNIKLYLGTNVLVQTTAINNAANDIFYVDCEVVIRTNGAGGTIVAEGVQGDGVPGTATAKPFSFASATLDSTVAELIKVTATWSAASASDIARLDVLNVDRIVA